MNQVKMVALCDYDASLASEGTGKVVVKRFDIEHSTNAASHK